MNFTTLNQNQIESTVISSSSLTEMLTVVPATKEKVPYGLGYFQHENNSWWHGGANAGWMSMIGINPKHNKV